MKLSVIFSFRNESENINELISRTFAAVDQISEITQCELIFVDDDSTDDSNDRIRKWMRTSTKYEISLYRTTRRFGPAACLLEGLARAKGDLITYFDSDLQDPPELLPEMYKKLSEGFDIVHAKRRSRDGESRLRLFLTKIAYKLIKTFAQIPLEVEVGDYKLFNRVVADAVLKLNEQNPYLRGLFVWVGYKQTTVMYDRQPRFGGSSNVRGIVNADTTNSLLNGLISFTVKPIFVYFYFALLMGLFLLLAMTLALFSWAAGAGFSDVRIIALLVLGVAAFNAVSFSVTLLYIMKIFENSLGRPRALFREGD
jgi:polyisoprenyl-phosphate glycosyltransferase